MPIGKIIHVENMPPSSAVSVRIRYAKNEKELPEKMNIKSQRKEMEILQDKLRLDTAWNWLCQTRKRAPADADIWDMRFHWSSRQAALLAQLQTGAYRLSPMQVVGQQRHVMWSAEDALVLKWVALALEDMLPLHEKCEHVKGHGGGRASVVRLQQAILKKEYSWVCRTDIKGYYANISKSVLLDQLKRHVKNAAYMNILTQYVHYSVEDGGEFYTPGKGIARGCALSPLMGALHLWDMDHHFSQQENIYYARYMDDVVIMAKTRWTLRRHIRALNGHFEQSGFHQHPDKTFIGRLAKGFDWMGAQLGATGVTGIAPRAVANHEAKVRRLYEQTRSLSKAEQIKRVSGYLLRWTIWAGSAIVPVCHAQGPTVLIRPGGASAEVPHYEMTLWNVKYARTNQMTDLMASWTALGDGEVDKQTNSACATLQRPPSIMAPARFGYLQLPLGGTLRLIYNVLPSVTATTSDGVPVAISETDYGNGVYCAAAPLYGPQTLNLRVKWDRLSIDAAAGTPPQTTDIKYCTQTLGLNGEYQCRNVTVQITESPICTISIAEPTVLFDVPSPFVNPVIARAGRPSYQCEGYDHNPTAHISVKAPSLSGSSTSLPLLSTASAESAIGTIRGSVGPSGCNDNTSSIHFNGPPHAYTVSNQVSGTIPLTWTLCPMPAGQGVVGAGKASATLDVTWD